MRSRKRERARNGQETVSQQAVMVMGNRAADCEQQHASRPCCNHTQAAMAPKSDAERKNTERQNNDKHLRVQVPLVKTGKKGQAGDNKWKNEAMNKAQRRQRDGGTVEPIGRICGILIH